MTTPRSIAASVAAAALSLVGACATELDDVSDADVVLDAAAVIDDGVIVGSLDWVEASTLSGIAKTAANASGYVSIPQKGSRCSGFLISRDIVMTNHHCIPDAASAAGVIVNFKYETAWDETGVVACDQFIGANADLDYALVRCAGTPGDTYGFLTIDPSALATGKSIQLLHQQCDYATTPSCEPTKKLSPGKITATTRIADRITHDADMLGGSSGGAIIAPGTTNVVAINNAHYVPNGSTDFRGTTNIGVPMSLIVPDMQERFPQLFANCASIPAGGRIIDEDDDCTTLGGQTRFWRSIEGNGHDGDLVWTGTTANSTVGNSAEWALKFAAAG
ncbi:MAG TPA: serine protease, partial [Myxococcota bacterium]